MPTTPNHNLPYPEGTDPANVPADFQSLAEAVDGELDNIAPAQIAGVPAGRLLIANGSGVVTGVAMSGDGTISPTGVLSLANGSVTNGKVAADAAIDHSKLAAMDAGRMLIGNGSNVPTATQMSGDASLSSSGQLSIGDQKVTRAKIEDGAVNSAKLDTAAVGSTKIADGAVTRPKMSGFIQTARVAIPGGVAASSIKTVEVPWPSAFLTTSYTATVTLEFVGSQNLVGLTILRVLGKLASRLEVVVANNSGGTLGGSIHAIGIAD